MKENQQKMNPGRPDQTLWYFYIMIKLTSFVWWPLFKSFPGWREYHQSKPLSKSLYLERHEVVQLFPLTPVHQVHHGPTSQLKYQSNLEQSSVDNYPSSYVDHLNKFRRSVFFVRECLSPFQDAPQPLPSPKESNCGSHLLELLVRIWKGMCKIFTAYHNFGKPSLDFW